MAGMLTFRNPTLRRLVLRPSLAGRHHFCSTSPKHGEAEQEKAESEEVAKHAPVTARTARDAEDSAAGSGSLSRIQRAGIGGLGTILATSGFGYFTWLNWPLLGMNSMCGIAGSCGVALLAVAAKGELPKAKEKAAKPEKKLQLKLLNDEIQFKSDMEDLRKLGSHRQWPQGVQAALSAADKTAAATLKTEKTERAKDLLEQVKSELAAGTSPDMLRQRLRPRLFVFDFKSSADPMAARPGAAKAQLEMLGSTVSFILSAATKYDEAMLRLTSPGGAVPTYGLAAAQLQRLRDAGVRVTVCVDTVAASGGYMMACVADQIVAAPFAMIGSIGVIAGLPNIHKVLDRNEVEYTQVTAGKYKRTVNVLTPNTEEGLAKFREDVDVIHVAFQEHITQFRPSLDIDKVATGEVWLGSEALRRGLVDQIGTSDEQICRMVEDGFDAIELTRAEKKKQGLSKLFEGIGGAEALEEVFTRTRGVVKGMWARFRGGAFSPRVEAPHLHGGGE